MILAYLAIIQRTNDIIVFEMRDDTGNPDAINIYEMLGPNVANRVPLPLTTTQTNAIVKITDQLDDNVTYIFNKNIFKIPLDDDTYNTNDEKRYLYGITYYFGGRPWEPPRG
jgi:hypothetical protein